MGRILLIMGRIFPIKAAARWPAAFTQPMRLPKTTSQWRPSRSRPRLDGSGAAFFFEKSGRSAGQPTMYLDPPIHFGGISIGIDILLDMFSLL